MTRTASRAFLAVLAMAVPANATVLTGGFTRLDGVRQSFSAYRGDVVLVVNTASRCGYTPQFEALETLYKSRRAQGLVVIGFPSNDFGAQEPLTNRGIAKFCKVNYGVSFPMSERVSVVGKNRAPIYVRLAKNARTKVPPSWNFTKYLIDRDGKPVARFEPAQAPDDPALLAAVDRELATRTAN